MAEVFEKDAACEENLTEIRLPIDSGIVGQVATNGKMMVVNDAYSHPLFYKKVDQRTGFTTKNILCIPIKDANGTYILVWVRRR